MSVPTPGLVSIVTPTLDAAAFLSATIESVLAQSYPAIEYFLVDGGSHDETLRIAASYGNAVRIVELPSSTQAEAIREGFRRANGEYYAFLGADDTLEPTAIAQMVDILNRNPGSPFVYGEAVFVDEAGAELGRYPTAAFHAEALAQSCFVCQPATLIRASAYDAAGGIDAGYDAAFDYDLWTRLTRAARPARIHDLCARARMHRATKSYVSRRANLREICTIVRKNYGYVPFSWVHAYAGVLATGQDLFFDPPSGSPKRTLLTLWLGWSLNARHPGRFTAEFYSEVRRLRRAAKGEAAPT